ncbi:MAG: D-alanine aminotransferase, partial [uncultured Acetobacteraceae bacterium]
GAHRLRERPLARPALGRGEHRGPRLPVRGRRVRGGPRPRRALHRRGAPPRPPRPQPARDQAARTHAARRAPPSHARAGAPEPGCRRVGLHAGDTRRGAPRPRLPAPARAAGAGHDREAHPALPARRGRLGGVGHHGARPALGAARHQEPEPAAERAGPAGGARGGGGRGHPLRRGDRRRHGRRRHVLLDRGRARHAPHPAPRSRHPAGLHPGRADRGTGRGRHSPRGARVHLGRNAAGAGGLPHLRDLFREADHPPGRPAGRGRDGRARDSAAVRPLRQACPRRPQELGV